MIVIGYFSALLIGLVLGLLGGGGSILGVPVFVYFFGIGASLATAYSLFVVGVSSLVGTFSYLRKSLVDFKVGPFFLIPSMAGVWVSRRLVLPAISPVVSIGGFSVSKDRLILLVFAAVMAVASYSMLRPRNAAKEIHASEPNSLLIAVYGLLAGVLMGFVGAGGGFLIIPILVGLGKIEMKRAIGTSLFIIAVSSLFGFAVDLLAGVVIDWAFLLGFSALSILGIVVGAGLSGRFPSQALKRAFGIMVLVIAVVMITKELFFGN